MRSRISTLLLLALALTFRLEAEGQGYTQATVSWNPSPTAGLAGYYLVWGTNSGAYFATNTYGPNQTTGVISNLQYNVVYYISVAAFTSNGLVSPFSNETLYSSNSAPIVTNQVTTTAGPPPPPGSGSSKPGGSRPAPPGTGSGKPGGSGTGSGTTAGGQTGTGSSQLVSQAQIWGIPPLLNIGMTNSQPTVTIGGTVGATLNIQGTSDLSSPYSWVTITNITVTNLAPIASSNVPGQQPDAIDLAYVPGVQATQLPANTSGPSAQFFRAVMPYDYIVLAGIVLPPKGYNARLIMVNMPGLNDDCCYVSQSGSFIHYNRTNSVLQLAGSGSTIRQIATTLANNLNLDWTTASEFVYSNGVGQVLATVVEADPASSDPVAGQTPTSSIVINF